MLRQTFLHVPGVGRRTELRLWGQGCDDWSLFLADPAKYSFGRSDRESVRRAIEQSEEALGEGRHQFFRRGLGRINAWRALPEFAGSRVYLDIETDGGQGESSITMIGLYDGRDFKCLVQGEDLANFPDIISHYSVIVTFAGWMFDLPVLERAFGGLRFDQIHVDLCPTLRQVGLRGGLKRIERELGVARDGEVDGLTGLDAVRLWRRYKRFDDEAALQRLIAYNRADVVNLERLSQIAYDRLRRQTMLPVQPTLW